MDVLQYLGYSDGWPSRPVQPILKVKWASNNTYPPIRWFSCAITNIFFDDQDSKVKKV